MALETKQPAVQTVGNYDLLEKIAEGGMGSVHRARDRTTGQTVALKIVPPHNTHNPVLMKRFEQEYAASKTLDHPNIVRALDFGYHGTSPYLVMEFIEGETLGQQLEREGRIAEPEAIRLIAQVAQGLHKAHKAGLIHRDVKPDNVLVTRDGTAKITDLGLVKELETDLNLTRTGRGLGTPFFMAPEQFRNAKNADARCDIYSLAASLYMLLTGELPFKALGPLEAWMKKINNELTPARALVPTLSERTDWAIRRAMSADPNLRPANCREFVEDLTGHSTRKITPLEVPMGQEFWYLVYKDEDEVMHTVKGALQAIRRSLKEGYLGDASNVRACRTKLGPFEPLRNHPEFRDLVVIPPAISTAAQNAPAKKSPTPTAVQSVVAQPATASARVPATPTFHKPPTPVPDRSQAVHINLGGIKPRRRSLLPWLLIALAVLATATLGFFLLPIVIRLGLF
jgi:serine/threonine protein kinase